MFYLIWKNYDGYHNEEYDDIPTLAKGLLGLSVEEKNDDYGTEILALVEGSRVDWEYYLDEINRTETVTVRGATIITKRLPDLVEDVKLNCPTCHSKTERRDTISTFVDGEYSTLIRYKCSECGKEFYI